MGENTRVSSVVIRRLPLYYRYLETLEREGVTRISSKELGEQMGFTASQVRQDINCFGAFGQQGYGYHVAELRSRIGEILGLGGDYHMIVVGIGNIGQAIVQYPGFQELGFRVHALFDVSARQIGMQLCGLPIQDVARLPEYLQSHAVDIAAICTPRGSAQQIADILVQGGVKGIWNFAPVSLSVPPAIAVNHVHMTDNLMVLAYKLGHPQEM